MALNTKAKFDITNSSRVAELEREILIREIVAEIGPDVATKRMVRTAYKKKNHLSVLSDDEKQSINYHLNKIVDELTSLPQTPESKKDSQIQSSSYSPQPASPKSCSQIQEDAGKGLSRRAKLECRSDLTNLRADSLVVKRQSQKSIALADNFGGRIGKSTDSRSRGIVSPTSIENLENEALHSGTRIKVKGVVERSQSNVDSVNGSTTSRPLSARFNVDNSFQPIKGKTEVIKSTIQVLDRRRFLQASAVRARILETDSESDTKQSVNDSDSEFDASKEKQRGNDSGSEYEKLYLSVKRAIESDDSEVDQRNVKRKIIDSEYSENECDRPKIKQEDSDSEYSKSEAEREKHSLREFDQCDVKQDKRTLQQRKELPTKKRRLSPLESDGKCDKAAKRRIDRMKHRKILCDSDSECYQSDVSSILSSPAKLVINEDSPGEESPLFVRRKVKSTFVDSESECEEIVYVSDLDHTLVEETTTGNGRMSDCNSLVIVNSSQTSDNEGECEQWPEKEGEGSFPDAESENSQTECQEDLELTLTDVNVEQQLCVTSSSEDSSNFATENGSDFRVKVIVTDCLAQLRRVRSCRLCQLEKPIEEKKLYRSDSNVQLKSFSSDENDIDLVLNCNLHASDKLDLKRRLKWKKNETYCKDFSDNCEKVLTKRKKRKNVREDSLSSPEKFEAGTGSPNADLRIEDNSDLNENESQLLPNRLESNSESESDVNDNCCTSETEKESQTAMSSSTSDTLFCFTSEESDVPLSVVGKSFKVSDSALKNDRGNKKPHRSKKGLTITKMDSFEAKHFDELVNLRKICHRSGVVLRNSIELKGCDSTLEKVERIKAVLKERGMKGKPTMKKADQFLLEKELKELKELGSSVYREEDDCRRSRSRSQFKAVTSERSEKLLIDRPAIFSRMTDIFTSDDWSD